MKKILVTLFLISLIIYAAEPVLVWDKTYNNGNDDRAFGVDVDSQGYVYVAGFSNNGTDDDAYIVVYSSDGEVERNMEYDGGFRDMFFDVAVDGEGNIYACGYTYNGTDDDGLIIKYNSVGDSVWARAVDIPFPGNWDNEYLDIELRGTQVYVAGYFETVSSNALWVQTRNTTDGSLIDGYNYISADMDDDDEAYGIALDMAGNSFVAGKAGYDYLIVKLDDNLDTVWTRKYDAGDIDVATGIDLDDGGYIYASGLSGYSGYYTIKCAPDGIREWGDKYSPNTSINYGYGVAVDEDFVYVPGVSTVIDGSDTSMLSRILCYDKQGTMQWFEDYDYEQAAGTGIVLDDAGYMYVCGFCEESIGTVDMLILKYQLVTGVEEGPSTDPLMTLAVANNLTTNPTLYYSLPAGQPGTLTLYSADGRKLESYILDPALSRFSWTTKYPAGVYLAVLKSGNYTTRTKFILTN